MFIVGKIAVKNALTNQKNLKDNMSKLYLSQTLPKQVRNEYITLTKNKIDFEIVSDRYLEKLLNKDYTNCQGIVLEQIKNYKYLTLDELLHKVKNKEKSVLVLLDSINDPVNFGSIIRSSAFFGVDGIIIMKDRQVEVTPTVSKISTGALEYVDIIKVTNLSQTIEKLKENNYFVYASSDRGDNDFSEVDYANKTALVIGNEGKGISQLVLKNSDMIVQIPKHTPISSLNANVACACFLSMIVSKLNKSK